MARTHFTALRSIDGPEHDVHSQSENPIFRSRVIKPDALREFQAIDQAARATVTRPILSFSDEETVNAEAWFENNTDKMTIAWVAWVISRLNDDKENKSVPAWAPFNEAKIIVDPQLTTADMLPIL